ncbi:hypothetical protein [Pontibacter rugosus]
MTQGSHAVAQVVVFGQTVDERELLRLAAGVEQHSEHYIAQGILKKQRQKALWFLPPKAFTTSPAKGWRAP